MKKLLVLLYITSIIILTGCGDQALFDFLAESNIKVRIKGTYASNNPRDWDFSGIVADDDQDNYAAGADYPTKFMIDIAELKLNGDKFAHYREAYQASVLDTDDFFNGTGFVFENDNVFPDDKYTKIHVFLRKMIFNKSLSYSVDNDVWSDPKTTEVVFNEKDVNGYDFNQRQTFTYYDEIDDDKNKNIVFPLKIPLAEDFIYDVDREFVLEVRLVIKNFIKKYEWVDSDVGYTYFGLSDWLRDIRIADKYRGGNLFAVARVYVKGETVSVSGTDAVGGSYVVAIPYTEDGAIDSISNYEITQPTTSRPSGDYDTDEASWDAYEAEAEASYDKKLPPIATWTDDNTYTLTNVPTGKNYSLYYTNSVAAGEMPSSFTHIKNIAIDVNGNITTL